MNRDTQVKTTHKNPVSFCFAPNIEGWRQAISWMWQDQLRRGEHETFPVIGKDLCAGDKVVLAGTFTLVELEAPLKSGSNFGRTYTLWACRAISTPAQAVCTETFYSQSVYRVLPKPTHRGIDR
jgi:hypothetical protein